MTWTKYETGFPVHDTARPLGLSSETRSIVPISKKPNRKICTSACGIVLKEIRKDRNKIILMLEWMHEKEVLDWQTQSQNIKSLY